MIQKQKIKVSNFGCNQTENNFSAKSLKKYYTEIVLSILIPIIRF